MFTRCLTWRCGSHTLIRRISRAHFALRGAGIETYQEWQAKMKEGERKRKDAKPPTWEELQSFATGLSTGQCPPHMSQEEWAAALAKTANVASMSGMPLPPGLNPTSMPMPTGMMQQAQVPNPDRHTCASCKAVGKMLKCSGCGQVRYCNRSCAKSGWKGGHKAICASYALVGKRVELHSLAASSEFNGRKGVVESVVEETGRVVVNLDSDSKNPAKSLSVKRDKTTLL